LVAWAFQLQHDNSAAVWFPGSAESIEHFPGSERIFPEGVRGSSEGGSISSRIGDEQDDAIERSVAALQREAAFERLNVVDDGFSFDGHPPAATLDDGVPRAAVAVDRERHLESESQLAVKSDAKPVEEARVASVADRIATRIGLDGQLESQGIAKTGKAPVRNVRRSAAFDPTDLRVRHPRRRRERAKAEPVRAPHPPKLITEQIQGSIHHPVQPL
jgi:hypothetical protein